MCVRVIRLDKQVVDSLYLNLNFIDYFPHESCDCTNQGLYNSDLSAINPLLIEDMRSIIPHDCDFSYLILGKMHDKRQHTQEAGSLIPQC